MKMKRALLPFLVIVIALVLTFVLVKSRKTPKPHETPHLGPLVEIGVLTKANRQILVSGTGSAQSRYEVSITPQVKGRVSELSPQMVAGGTFQKDELLFAIEDLDYQLAIAHAQATLAQAELELLRNENLADLARKEWHSLNSESDLEPNPLVVYEPQLKSARALRDAAQANVKQAELNLQRTRIYAPFDCYVRSEQLEIGQFLIAGAPVATVAGIDQIEIVVPVSLDEIVWLQVPRKGTKQRGSLAKVELQSGGRTFHWQGELTRSLGEIDPRNRMARVVVTVNDPFTEDTEKANLLNDLLPGMFVNVQLLGEELPDVISVPRGALHDNDTIWVIDDENRLHIREVDILRRERDEVLIRSGLDANEKIVLTNLSGAAEGMLLRPKMRETN
ncbi:efflux RND transporter periplasmic adaptor subunit [Deltaproteobacteria bacterium IMCC39524]|nr:efflux RND transporter periplasmic adaptor subunit [Deltaproteobacteria bacterium IMCC39524]